jgi:hypothetical protein
METLAIGIPQSILATATHFLQSECLFAHANESTLGIATLKVIKNSWSIAILE